MVMTNYERGNNTRLTKRLRTVLLCVLVVLVFVSWGPGIAGLATRSVLALFSPAWSIQNTVVEADNNFFALFRNKSDLSDENEELRRQSAELTLVRAENDRLQKTIAELSSARGGEGVLPARVLTKPPQSLYDTLIIDVEVDRPIRRGMTVLSLDGAALGSIADVNGSRAKVLLFSSSGVQSSGTLTGSSTSLELSGRGGGTFRAIVPRAVGIGPGDSITAPLYGSRVIALVESVLPDKTQLTSEVFARTPVALTTLNWVLVVYDSSPRP